MKTHQKIVSIFQTMWYHFCHWESGSLKNKLFSFSRSKFFLFGSETSAYLRNHMCYIMWYSNWCLVLLFFFNLYTHRERNTCYCSIIVTSSDIHPWFFFFFFDRAVQYVVSQFPNQTLAVKMWSPNQWTARKFSLLDNFFGSFYSILGSTKKLE